jgi:hypothetical protein
MLPLNGLLSAEARLLLLAAEAAPSANRVIEGLRDQDLDWNRLVALAEREKATAVLWSLIRSYGDDVPAARVRQLGMLASVSDFRMRHHEKLLGKVLDTLNELDIPVILLKGAALAVTAYGSFTRRPMYDLDLLVRPEDAEHAWNALRQSGWLHEEDECPIAFYEDHYHLPPLDDPDGTGLAVELHTRPWQGGVRLDAGEIREESLVIDWAERQARVPSTRHQILHLATHFAWGHMLRSGAWRTVRDLGTLVGTGDVDWGDIVALARKTGGTACCYWTFDIARCLADVPVPDEVLDELRPPISNFAVAKLRRHYIGTLFGFSPAPCPSRRLERLLWTAGHAPRRTQLGDLRPWMRGDDWVEHAGTTPTMSLAARVRTHLKGLRAWVNYIRAVSASSHSA